MERRTRRRLSSKFVERVLRGQEPDGRYADGGNLYCLVRGSSASWVFMVNSGRSRRQYAIGSVKALADTVATADVGRRARASLDAARAEADRFRANVISGREVRSTSRRALPTFDEIVAHYLRVRRTNGVKVKAATSHFRAVLNDFGGGYTKRAGVAYRDRLLAAGKAENTIANYMGQVRAIFSCYIADHEGVIENPLGGVVYQKKSAAVGRRNSLPADVIRDVYHALEGDYRHLWLVLVVTGARLNEVYGMKSADVRSDGFLHIQPNARRKLKNVASERLIPLFVDLPQRSTEYYWSDMGSVSALSQRFQKRINPLIAAEMRGTRQLTTHSLRHSMTDLLRSKIVHEHLEDRFLGHASKSVSGRVYGTLDETHRTLARSLGPVIKEYLQGMGLEAAWRQV